MQKNRGKQQQHQIVKKIQSDIPVPIDDANISKNVQTITNAKNILQNNQTYQYRYVQQNGVSEHETDYSLNGKQTVS